MKLLGQFIRLVKYYSVGGMSLAVHLKFARSVDQVGDILQCACVCVGGGALAVHIKLARSVDQMGKILQRGKNSARSDYKVS